MKIGLLSDLHAHPFRAYAEILEGGINSRLRHAIDVVEECLEVCLEQGVQALLFGGDLFHVRRKIDVTAFNLAYEVFARFPMNGIELVMIHGNHDQADKHGSQHSVHAFRTFASVIDEPGWEMIDTRQETIGVFGVPYTENLEHLRQAVQEPCPWEPAPKIFLGHLGIQGAKVGADFVYTNPHDAKVSDLSPSRFDAVWLGHYHIPQTLDYNSHYIGAPLHHNWGDRNQKRGFVIYDTETMKHKRHLLRRAPRFTQVISEAELCEYVQSFEGDYLRLVTAEEWSEDRREAKRQELGARSFEVVPPKIEAQVQEARIEVDPSTSIQDILDQYVKSGVQPADELDLDYLIQIGRNILEQVEE